MAKQLNYPITTEMPVIIPIAFTPLPLDQTKLTDDCIDDSDEQRFS